MEIMIEVIIALNLVLGYAVWEYHKLEKELADLKVKYDDRTSSHAKCAHNYSQVAEKLYFARERIRELVAELESPDPKADLICTRNWFKGE